MGHEGVRKKGPKRISKIEKVTSLGPQKSETLLESPYRNGSKNRPN